MAMSWKFFWSFLFTFNYWRKSLWFLTFLFHIPSIVIRPQLDDVCFAGNFSRRKNHTDVQTLKNSLEMVYFVAIQSIVMVVFLSFIYTLIVVRMKDMRDERVVKKLSKLRNPAHKSAAIWKLLGSEKPFDYSLCGGERGIIVAELLFSTFLAIRFFYHATCALRGGTIFTVATSQVKDLMLNESFTSANFNLLLGKNVTDIVPYDVMPNAAFILANFDLLLTLVLVILWGCALEILVTLVVFHTPTFRPRILESLCEGSEGKLAARSVARDLSLRQLWSLCSIGLRSPKHFTHAVIVIRKELDALQEQA